MKIEKDIILAQFTTFKIGGPADFFCSIKNEKELLEAISFAKEKGLSFFVIGGGSNILISDLGYRGLVIKMDIGGIDYKDGLILSGAGENWDNFVKETVERGFYGLENLSAIPGTVGASPVQNIGAYGVEVGDYIDSVRVFDTKQNLFTYLDNSQCLFGYRDSIFKHQKGRYIITSVIFNLKNKGSVNISYSDLKDFFAGKDDIQIKDVRDAVINIRKSKLPDWNEWGTAGSFFKNPLISVQDFIDLKQKFPDIKGFPDCEGKVKVSLGWILDKVCNAKELFVGNAGVYSKQALVLVAKTGAKASEVIELSRKIQSIVKEKTGINIEAEVEWVV